MRPDLIFNRGRRVPVCVALLFCLVVSGCGGGGGGGGGSSSASTGVRILHASIDAAPVDIISATNANQLVQTARFGQETLYAALSQGTQDLRLTLTQRPSQQIAAFLFEVAKNERRSVLLFGGNDRVPLQARALLDSPGTLDRGQSALRIVHAAYGAASIRVLLDSQVLVDGLAYGEASSYVSVAVGTPNLVVQRTSDGQVLASRVLALESQKPLTILLGGELGYYVSLVPYQDD